MKGGLNLSEHISVLAVHKMTQEIGLEVSYDYVKAQLVKAGLVQQVVKGGTMAVSIDDATQYVEDLRDAQIAKCEKLLKKLKRLE